MIRLASLLTLAAALLWPAIAAAVAWIIGGLVSGDATISTIWIGSGVVLAAGATRLILTALAAAWLDGAADRCLARERAETLRREDHVSPQAAARPGSAATAALLTDKLQHLRPYILRYRPAKLRAAVVPLALLALILPVSWAAALILLIAGPLIPVFMALVGMAARDASARQMEEIGTLSTMLGEHLGALFDIRLLDARERMVARFETHAETLRARTMAVLGVAFLSSTVLELFSALGVAMVAVYVGFTLLGEIGFGDWQSQLTLSEGVFLLMLAPEFFQPLRDLAAAWHDKAAALAVASELTEREAAEPDNILGQGADTGSGSFTNVALTGVSRGPLIFPDLTLAAGGSIAITGPSGSGKSTLIALIGGVLAADRGTVEFDGTPLKSDTADAIRAGIGWVPQTPHFLAGPLRDTLTLGCAEATDQAIASALDLACATDIVARLPRGLDTVLGETGAGVSGGEARRLMLARAALQNRPLLLADEPTADLDHETADEIILTLTRLNSAGMTVIVATHDSRLSAAMKRQTSLVPADMEAVA